jgi:predicted GIY-YIG superfamily endonuclease
MSVVYLLHFSAPLAHARHYIGTARDLAARLERHHKGSGARLTAVLNEKGIDYTLVRTWNGGRKLERQLKRQNNAARMCPICNPKHWITNKTAPDLVLVDTPDLDALLGGDL